MIRVFAQRLAPRAFTLIVFETGLIVLAVWAAAYVRLGQWTWEVLWTPHGIWKVLLVSAVCQVCLYYADLYDFRRLADRREIFTRVTWALGAASFILAAVHCWFPALVLGRGVFIDHSVPRDVAGRGVANRVRVVEPPTGPARAAAPPRNEPGRADACDRAAQPTVGAGRRDRGVQQDQP